MLREPATHKHFKASDSLERITSSFASINDMNTQIASAAEEQATVSEENASAMTQTTASSKVLAHMAACLQEMIGRLKQRERV